jgi:hypothetical protein
MLTLTMGLEETPFALGVDIHKEASHISKIVVEY